MNFKKGQFWYTDFLIGLFILMIITVLFTVTIVDINSREDVLQSLIDDGVSISNSLMSEGYLTQEEWKEGEGRIGFVKNGKVDNDNLDSFWVISKFEYGTSKYLLGTLNNYAMYFEDKEGNIIDNKFYGRVSSLEDLGELEVENLVKFTRFVYKNSDEEENGEIVKLILLLWEPDRFTITDEQVCSNAETYNLCTPLEDLFPQYRLECCTIWDYCKMPDGSC